LGEPVGHQDDHGPQDHGFVAGGQGLVVPDGTAVLADPGEGPLHNPAAGQDLEDVTIALSHDLDRHLRRTGPGSQLACAVSSVGPDQQDLDAGAVQVPGAVAATSGSPSPNPATKQPDLISIDIAGPRPFTSKGAEPTRDPNYPQ
jgi:hypothetical protein